MEYRPHAPVARGRGWQRLEHVGADDRRDAGGERAGERSSDAASQPTRSRDSYADSRDGRPQRARELGPTTALFDDTLVQGG
jgi:hypothetical protein